MATLRYLCAPLAPVRPSPLIPLFPSATGLNRVCTLPGKPGTLEFRVGVFKPERPGKIHEFWVYSALRIIYADRIVFRHNFCSLINTKALDRESRSDFGAVLPYTLHPIPF